MEELNNVYEAVKRLGQCSLASSPSGQELICQLSLECWTQTDQL